MKQDQLLQPRYKIVGMYPLSPFKMDQILYQHNTPESGFGKDRWYSLTTDRTDLTNIFLPGYVEPYPNLFRKMNWWEDRDKNDLPEYIIQGGIHLYKVIHYNLENEKVNVAIENGAKFINIWNITPSTEKEYNDYVNRRTVKAEV
jgi:hypothetical protein